jgi:hypothetical protein
MAGNGKPQLVKNIFSQQSNVAAGEAVDASVVQDKTALTRGRTALAQPEPQKIVTRSHPLNNNLQRSKKHGSTKRKTVHLVLWVKPIVKAELKHIADRKGLSLSQSGAAFLKRSLQ